MGQAINCPKTKYPSPASVLARTQLLPKQSYIPLPPPNNKQPHKIEVLCGCLL
jgi:hypothetical protein